MSMLLEETPPRPLRWWDLACAGVLIFTGVVAVIDAVSGEPHWAGSAAVGWRVAILLAPIPLIAAHYATLGREPILRGSSGSPIATRGGVFLALLLALLVISAFIDPMYAMLQAIAYPIVWTIAHEYRTAVMWCLAVALAIGAGLYLGLVTKDPEVALLTSLLTSIISLVFAIAMGTWISRIHDRGESYRELAKQLDRSRGEVAALSEAAGAAAERERMSRDLHDTLTQTLTGLVMLAEQTERALDADDETRARDRLTRVAVAARAAVAEARALVATTQPIGEGGLVASIERVANTLRADTGLEVELEVDYRPEQLALDREREVVLLRAAQEGLANARKHSGARRVAVFLSSRADGGARLIVDDDGRGSEPERTGGGFGLTGIADRVRSVGGEMSFGARRGGGSRLEVGLDPTTGPIDGTVGSIDA